jgi:predicted ferric reductase
MQPQNSSHVTFFDNNRLLFGWLITAAACLLGLGLWLVSAPLDMRGSNVYDLMSSVGNIMAITGLILYSLSLVYSVRIHIIDRIFGGLNRAHVAHHFIGGIGLVLLVTHPILSALGMLSVSSHDAALQLVPKGLLPISALFNSESLAHASVLQQWGTLLGTVALLGLILLAAVTFFVKLPFPTWRRLYRGLGWAFFLSCLHILLIDSDTNGGGLLKVYLLAFVALGLGAFVYTNYLKRTINPLYRYKVDRVAKAGTNVTQLILIPLGETVPYHAGQFIFVRFIVPGAKKYSSEWHPFSVSSAPEDNYIELNVKTLGDYTSALVALRPDTIAEIDGAYGSFSYTDYDNPHQVWVAGGIGVMPFLSMARSLPEKNFKIDLYYSMNTSSEVIDWPVLNVIANHRHGNFRVIPFVVDEQKSLLSADYIEKISGKLPGKEILLCCPAPMSQAVRKQLLQKGVPRSAIHSEEFAVS